MPQSDRVSQPSAAARSRSPAMDRGDGAPDWTCLAAPLRRLADRQPEQLVAALRALLKERRGPPKR